MTELKKQRIVIIGGPGSGKTTLINHLEQKGYACMHEISRAVTKKAQDEGIDQLFLEKPLLFSQMLLDGRLQQFNDAAKIENPIVFYDRGLPDVTIYMDYIETEYPETFTNVCQNNRYDHIFMLPPWETIYKKDNERYESFEQAQELYQFLLNGYQSYGYQIEEVPTGTIENRANFILQKLNSIS